MANDLPNEDLSFSQPNEAGDVVQGEQLIVYSAEILSHFEPLIFRVGGSVTTNVKIPARTFQWNRGSDCRVGQPIARIGPSASFFQIPKESLLHAHNWDENDDDDEI